jgi:hypothetical protein
MSNPKLGTKQSVNITHNQPRLTENKPAQKQAGLTGLNSPEPKLKQETGATKWQLVDQLDDRRAPPEQAGEPDVVTGGPSL